MKRIQYFLVAMLTLLVFSCQKQDVLNVAEADGDLLATVNDEVLADINFVDLLNDADYGMFWGDPFFTTNLKSAEIEGHCWAKRTKEEEGNKIVVTLEYDGTCDKNGTIVIEYLKPNDKKAEKKKNLTYIDFFCKGVTYNGTKEIVKGNDNYNVKGEMTIEKTNDDGEAVKLVRNYQREVHWICGMDTYRDRDDDIIKVTGKSEVTKTVGGEEFSYSRQILKPLLIVKACDLKIQAGSVKIEKGDGTKVEIDYGKMPKDVNCDFSTDDCITKFEVTKDGNTYQMELVDGKRVKVKTSDSK